MNAPIAGCVSNANAPTLDPTQSLQFAAWTKFLYTGSSPVQTGVAALTIDVARAAVIRGRVLGNDGATALVGATVTVVGHPEYGQTLTRTGGYYDLAVNAGTTYAVDINKAGFLRVQRSTVPRPGNWSIVPDVVMTIPYTSTDKYVPGASTAKLVRGQLTAAGTDADAQRRAVLYFAPGTRPTNYTVADGTLMDVQVTEYTVGNGPKRMPGTLPPTSGYTYALEVGFPAAAAAGVQDVQFNKNVSLYVDNFTGYPVGTPVPLGYYDRAKSSWVGEQSGRIIKIVTAPAGGQATIDIDGDNVAETTTVLDSFGIDVSERTALATQYAAGAKLWRCSVPHFSPWDGNWGYPPPDGTPPPDPNPQPKDPDDPCERDGSVIGCESRTLGEAVPIYGTPFSLNYQSERSPAFTNSVSIRVTDSTVPPPLLKAYIDIEVAGHAYHYQRSAPFVANDSFTWTWDGTDAYGNALDHVVVDATIRLSYEYHAQTAATSWFGEGGGYTITGDRAARTITLIKESHVSLRRSNPKTLGFGGWTMSVNHSLESLQTLYFGNGKRRDLSAKEQYPLNYLIDTVAGGGSYGSFNEGGAAVGAYVGAVEDLAIGPDLSLFLADDPYNNSVSRLRRVTRSGTISTIAGLEPVVARSPGSDGSAALHAQVNPTSLAVMPDGSIVFVEYNTNQIWKITADATPLLRLVAGTGVTSPENACEILACGDGGPATAAQLRAPQDIAVGPDGALYVADTGHSRIRRIGPDGKITSFFWLPSPYYIGQFAFAPDGSAFATLANDTVVKIPNTGGTVALDPNTQSPLIPYLHEPDGSLSYVNTGWCGTTASWAGDLQFAPDGSLLFTCNWGVQQRTPSAHYNLLAGSSAHTAGFSGDGGIALRALMQATGAIRQNVLGEMYAVDKYDQRIRKIAPPSARTSTGNFRVPAEDGSEVYEFSPNGQHLNTLSSLRGKARYTFGYNATTHLLETIKDEGDNTTTISRTSSAVTITAPHGQVTKINLDANGYAASIVNPVTTEITQVAHTAKGLLTDFTDPRGKLHHFDYALDGRLIKDISATPGSLGTRLTSTSSATGYTVEITSPEGRVTRHDVTTGITFPDPLTVERRTINSGAGLITTDYTADGATTVTRPNGTGSSVTNMSIDPQWGVMASFPSKVVTTNGSKSMTRDETRAATLSTPGDPTTLSAETITTTLSAASGPSAQTTTRVFTSGASPTWLTTSGAGRQVRETYDSLDRVTKTEILGSTPVTLNAINYAYDTQGRMWKVTWGTRTYQTNFNATTGWVDSTTVPASLGVTYNTRDTDGRPTLMTLPGSRSLAMGYDLAGNVTSVTPPTQPAHTFGFDPNNLLASYLPPDGTPSVSPRDTSYVYDKDSLLTYANNPLKPVSYSYDGIGRLFQRTDATTTTYAYDPQGRLATVSSGGVLVTNTWDGSLLTQQKTTGPFTKALNKSYDSFFRVASWDIDGSGAIALTYDNDNLVTGAGAMTVTRSSNGLLTGTTIGAVSDTWGYDAYGAVTSHAVTGSATAFNVTTTRDAAGRIDLRTEAIGGVTHSYKYGYDTAGRLASVKVDGASTPTRSWTYDGNGNRDGGTYDDQDRMTAFGGATYTYGNNGELASKTSGGVTTNYTYDANGNLRSTSGGAAITYVVDGRGRRVGRTKGGVFQGFVYDGTRIVAELDSSGSELSRFVYGTRSQSPDYMVRGGAAYRIVKDHLGSPRLVVNTSTGALAQRIDYDEWGNATIVGTELVARFQPFGFGGGLWDRDTNLIRFGARDYDPTSGRWVTKDRLRFAAGLNLYAYVGNDPVNWIDKTGRMKLPATPEGLGPEWTKDPKHMPKGGGGRWTHPSGDELEFHEGVPGKKGFGGKDHWHHVKNGKKEDKHLNPGDQIPDPAPVCESPTASPSDNPDPDDEGDSDPEQYEAHVPWYLLLPLAPLVADFFGEAAAEEGAEFIFAE